jgi:hypothetical protein
MLAWTSVLAVGLWYCTPAHAWGSDGHRVVGDIAWHFLQPRARDAVHEYLTDERYSTLAEAATWADTYARRFRKYDKLKPLHYVDVSAQAASYLESRDCPKGCVVSAIDKYVGVLSSLQDDTATWRERQQALYWVAHFVGDIHQPLHISHPDNRGGNATDIDFFGHKHNAHWVWDQGLIEKLEATPLGATERDSSGADEYVWQDFSYSLWIEITPDQVKSWQSSVSPKDWANESLALAKQQAFLHPGEVIDQAYVAAHTSAVREQLKKAGVRLAAVLNKALGT